MVATGPSDGAARGAGVRCRFADRAGGDFPISRIRVVPSGKASRFLFAMLPARFLLVSAALAGAAFWAPGAQALTTGTQISSSSTFSLTGTTTSAATLGFRRFNPNIVGDEKVNVIVTGYDYILTDVSVGGTVQYGNSTPSTINGPFNSQVTLNFDQLGASTSTVAFNPVSATSTGSLPPTSFPLLPISGSATNVTAPSSPISIAAVDAPQFTSPPATPLPSLTGYSASWAYISPPGPLTNFAAATVDGRIAVRWHYSYDVQTVPAPLPLLGAGVGFAFSRNLRRRIRGLA